MLELLSILIVWLIVTSIFFSRRAQYANEIGYSPDYMGSMNGRGPQTAAAMGVTPRNTGGMMAWPGPPQTTQYLHNQQQPPHYIQPPPPPVGAIPTPAHRPPPSAFLTPAPAAGFVPLMPPSAPTTPFIEANAPTRYDGYKQRYSLLISVCQDCNKWYFNGIAYQMYVFLKEIRRRLQCVVVHYCEMFPFKYWGYAIEIKFIFRPYF